MAIETKRFLDLQVHIYAGIVGSGFVAAYEAFMDVAFTIYTAYGGDAQINALLQGIDGHRREYGACGWQEDWDELFEQEQRINQNHVPAGLDGCVRGSSTKDRHHRDTIAQRGRELR